MLENKTLRSIHISEHLQEHIKPSFLHWTPGSCPCPCFTQPWILVFFASWFSSFSLLHGFPSPKQYHSPFSSSLRMNFGCFQEPWPSTTFHKHKPAIKYILRGAVSQGQCTCDYDRLSSSTGVRWELHECLPTFLDRCVTDWTRWWWQKCR